MDFSKDEINEWEQALHEHNLKRMYKTSKNYRCPRYEALQDYKHRKRNWHQYSQTNECKWVRTWTNRCFRRKLRRRLYNEAYYHPVAHDYKTYGRISW